MSHEDHDHLRCRKLAESMTAYIDDDLTPDDRLLIDKHLGECGGCHNYLDQMQHTIDTIKALRGSAPAPETRAKLLGLFRQWKQDREDC